MPGAQPPPLSTAIPFGPFEADLQAQELRKLGVHIRLPRQSFQILKMLLERPGELVTREEMRAALWPSDTFVDFEHGLNAAINRLREAVGDDADNPRYIETLPRRGYRFIAPITQPAPIQVTVTATDEKHGESVPERRKTNRWAIGLAFTAACALAGVGLHWTWSSLKPPRVLAYRQLTKDRRIKGLTGGIKSSMVVDGPRIFFKEGTIREKSLSQISTQGGDVVGVNAPFSLFRILDISPDKTELLIVSFLDSNEAGPDQPLWVLSLASGLARRVGEARGHAGAWSPDGQTLVYLTGNDFSLGNDLYIATKDGSNARKLTRVDDGYVWWVRWSPDASTLRMIAWRGSSGSVGSLWQVSADGTNLHRIDLFKGQSVIDGNWTADGKYFLVTVGKPNLPLGNIWALRESPSGFGSKVSQPIQLTTGTTSFWNPVASPDGKQVFVFGGQLRGELVRYDPHLGRVEPYLSGISAEQLDFSRDGDWVAYVTFPEGILWRSKIDGSEKIPLTGSSLYAAVPHWSPDGTRIAFAGLTTGGRWEICVVSAKGGNPQVVSHGPYDQIDPTWSPDGTKLVFGGFDYTLQAHISSVDLRTGELLDIPNSKGMFSPRMSPDGRFIAATNIAGGQKLFLFDCHAQKWSLIGNDKVDSGGWQVWSNDSKYLYTGSPYAREPALYRLRMADRKIERVATLGVPEGLTGFFGPWMAAAPDGSALLLRDLSINEIYELDVDLP